MFRFWQLMKGLFPVGHFWQDHKILWVGGLDLLVNLQVGG